VNRGMITAALGVSGALMAASVLLAPSALAANRAKSATLESWYQHTGHQVSGTLLADGNRFREVTASTTVKVERQDCKTFENDAASAARGKMPPQPAVAQEYRYFLQTAAHGFAECVTGLGAMNGVLVTEGNDIGAQAAGEVLRIITGAKTGQVVTVPTSAVNLHPTIPASTLIPQCESDFKVLEVAVAAYNAQTNANPVPPAPWSATTYAQNFAPLLSAKNGGPFMSGVFDTTHYVVEYDSSGNVWVEPPGQYDTSFNQAHGSNAACAAVVK
jgi:hypothetical protein